MRQNPFEKHLYATGGEENDLKLWDLNRPGEAVFKAKNVSNENNYNCFYNVWEYGEYLNALP